MQLVCSRCQHDGAVKPLYLHVTCPLNVYGMVTVTACAGIDRPL